MADLDQKLHDVASGPKKATGDGNSFETHSLQDLIDADRYLASRTNATTNSARSLRFAKFIPPGAIE